MSILASEWRLFVFLSGKTQHVFSVCNWSLTLVLHVQVELIKFLGLQSSSGFQALRWPTEAT